MVQKDRRRLNQNGLMFGKQNNGFTLIEILVAIALVAVMATLVLPNLGRFTPRYEREQFIAQLQELVQRGWQSSLSTGKIYRVHFDFKEKKISLGQATDQRDTQGDPVFEVPKYAYGASSLTWPSQIQFKGLLIEGHDELSKPASGRSTTEIWFFIMPEGLTQSVTINFIDMKDISPGGKPKHVSLVLSPFNALFKQYDTFQ